MLSLARILARISNNSGAIMAHIDNLRHYGKARVYAAWELSNALQREAEPNIRAMRNALQSLKRTLTHDIYE